MKGKLFLIVGPSGVGKGTLTNILRETHSDFFFPPSVTTRPPREGEAEGEVYNFISDEEFERRKDNNEFLEWAVVHATKKYATLRSVIVDAVKAGRVVVREVDIQGLVSIRENLPREMFTAIFISPPDLATIEKRILNRQPDIDRGELAHRLVSAEKELAQKNLADFEVVSEEGQIEDAVREVEKIIESETH